MSPVSRAAPRRIPVSFPSEEASVTVHEGDVFYTQEGMTVYNNGGTVFCNDAIVFNNGGITFVNSGLVYNNAGTIYANGGTVFNNAGTVYDNGATVFGFDDDGSVIFSEPAATASADVEISGRARGFERLLRR